jgi:hypothetical protein
MIFDLAGMRWSEGEVGWVDGDGHLIAAHRETAEGFHRDRVLMISEAVMAEVLRQNELVLAVAFSARDESSSATLSTPLLIVSGGLTMSGMRSLTAERGRSAS